jgi:hypothetical protein
MIIVKIMGGLGNQFFQYATARNLSLKHATGLKFDTSFYADVRYKGIYRLHLYSVIGEEADSDEITKLKNVTPRNSLDKILRRLKLSNQFKKETHIIEDPDVISQELYKCSEDLYLEGWWQNEKYFDGIKNILQKELRLKVGLSEANKILLEEIKNTESVSVHVRRGEFVNNSFFGVLPIEYYKEAFHQINKMLNNPVFYIFSDDIKWAKENFTFNLQLRFMENNSEKASIHHTHNDFEDMCLMINCKHHIIANSTFSWWPAWLCSNPDKKVIAPCQWYKDIKAQNLYLSGRLLVNDWFYL